MSTPPLTLKERLRLAAAKASAPAPEPETTVETTAPKQEPLTALERIKLAKAKADEAKTASPEPQTETSKQALTRVVTAANLVEKGHTAEARSEGGNLPAMQGLDLGVIRQKIADLQTLEDGPELKGQMDVLREMLLSNPDACATMLPEDLGLMVRALRKMTSNRVAADLGRAKPRASKTATPKLTAAEIAAAVEDGDWS